MSEPSPRDAGRPIPAGLTPGGTSWPEGWTPAPRERARPVVVREATVQISGTARTGVLFPTRPGWRTLLVSLPLGLIFAAGAIVLLVKSVLADSHYVAVIGVVILAGWAAAFIGAAGLAAGSIRRARRMPHGLLLTPHAVCGPDGKSVVPWEVIATIDTRIVDFTFRRRPVLPVRANYLRVTVTGTDRVEGLRPWIRRLSQRVERPTVLSLATRIFAGNAAAPLHALRYYLAHPQERPDLANGAALARIRG